MKWEGGTNNVVSLGRSVTTKGLSAVCMFIAVSPLYMRDKQRQRLSEFHGSKGDGLSLAMTM